MSPEIRLVIIIREFNSIDLWLGVGLCKILMISADKTQDMFEMSCEIWLKVCAPTCITFFNNERNGSAFQFCVTHSLIV